MTLEIQSTVKDEKKNFIGKRVAEEVCLYFLCEGAEAGQISDGGWERIEKNGAKK